MTKPVPEKNIYILSENAEHERNLIERIAKAQWLSDYALDIFNTMKESELRRRRLYYTSTQINQRPKLVQLCDLLIRSCKLTRCAFHLAIYYLDRIMDFYTVREDKLQLVAITCVHLAAQIESSESMVPRYNDMNMLIKGSYKAFEFKGVERKLLTFFNFELLRPTTASFVEMFACCFLTRQDYTDYCKALVESPSSVITYPHYNSFEHMLASLAQLLLRVCDYTLSICRFSCERPSLLAASCIGAVRQLGGLPTRWTPYLCNMTSYTDEMVEPFVDILTLYHYYQTSPVLSVRQPIRPPQLQNPNGSDQDSGFEESPMPCPQIEVMALDVQKFDVTTVKSQNACKKRVSEANDNEHSVSKRLKFVQEDANT